MSLSTRTRLQPLLELLLSLRGQHTGGAVVILRGGNAVALTARRLHGRMASTDAAIAHAMPEHSTSASLTTCCWLTRPAETATHPQHSASAALRARSAAGHGEYAQTGMQAAQRKL